MTTSEDAFREHIAGVLRRFFAQNEDAAPDAALLNAIGHRLWELIRERGLPRPLTQHERGEPGGMSDDECSLLVARVLDGAGEPLLAEASRQLVKACFYPEFKTCRDSFREVAPDGTCRRQELPRVLRRVSGAHCVDCPHWVALTPPQHTRYLERNWRAGAAEFAAHRDIYLPEDFRRLRQWLYTEARRNSTDAPS